MVQLRRTVLSCWPTILSLGIVGSWPIVAALAGDSLTPRAELTSSHRQRAEAQPTAGAVSPGQPVVPSGPQLTLTQAELRQIAARLHGNAGPTDDEDPDEIVVSAPAELLPMRDVTQDVWGGVAAPFWAIRNPTQAWRIFLPVVGVESSH